jgi:hypothetical protein
VKIGRTIYVRGNESIVGMEYGATRAQPEGDLKRLEALTRAAAGIARAVTGKVDELYDTQDPRADTSLLAELMLKGDHLVWNLRRQIERCAMAPFGALPAGSHHIEVPRAVIPPASAPPPLPPLPDIPENAPPAATVVHEPLSRRKPPVPGGASLASLVGSLKQRILRAETQCELQAVSAALRSLTTSSKYPASAAPSMALFPNDKQKLYYVVDRLWLACKKRDLAEADFRELLNHCTGKRKAARPGQSSAQAGGR